MATIYTPATAPFGAIIWITSALAGATGRVRAWNNTRRTIKALRGLTPRHLDDIGLTPANVEGFAKRGY